MGEEPVRWSIIVDKEMDIDVRTLLAQRGMKKGDLSKFVKEAVTWKLFDETVRDIRKNFEDMSSEEIDDLIDEAVAWARSPEGLASDQDADPEN